MGVQTWDIGCVPKARDVIGTDPCTEFWLIRPFRPPASFVLSISYHELPVSLAAFTPSLSQVLLYHASQECQTFLIRRAERHHLRCVRSLGCIVRTVGEPFVCPRRCPRRERRNHRAAIDNTFEPRENVRRVHAMFVPNSCRLVPDALDHALRDTWLASDHSSTRASDLL